MVKAKAVVFQAPNTEPRDVFFHLLAIVALYASAFNLGNLLFQFINIYLPDPITPEPATSFLGTIRSSLSFLVVSFPVYLWVSHRLEKDVSENPEKRNLRIRKWLLSLTLFLAALVIGGDLIALVQNYLNGELTLKIALKIAVVLAIAASIFRYYLWNLREEKPALSNFWMRLFVWGVILATLASIVAGFIIAGSPETERLRRLDERRVQDLSQIQNYVTIYWQSEKALPGNLAELETTIGVEIPTDPETGAPYEYQVLEDLKFELCATFKTEETSPFPRYFVKEPATIIDTWNHPAGYYCFERKINPELYDR